MGRSYDFGISLMLSPFVASDGRELRPGWLQFAGASFLFI
jgi:hypothetical protein